MTSFANLLPDIGGNRPPLTDEELRRLAVMLQDKGEGLAAINPKEAQMLKDAGGSGQPISGTQGFGVGGGPIRSYTEIFGENQITTEKAKAAGLDGTNNSGGGNNDFSDASGVMHTGPERDTNTYDTTPSTPTLVPDTTGSDEYTGLKAVMPGDDPPSAAIMHLYERDSESGNWILKPQGTTTVAQKDKGPDLDGNMHYSQETLDAANKNIRLREGKAFIQTEASTFTGDEDFETWFQTNKAGAVTLSDGTTITLEDVDKDELKAEFDDQMLLVSKESTAQTADFRSNAVNLFNDGTFTAQGKRTVNADGTVSTVTPTTFEEANAKMTELYPDSYGRLSLAQRQEVLESALKEFARIEAFTLTIADVKQFSRPAPEMGTITDILDTSIGTVTDATAPTLATVGDATAPTIDSVSDAADVTVDTVDDITITTLADVLDIASDAGELADVIADEDELIKALKERVAGEKPSVAEIQMKQGTEQNLKALLATTAGVMDPTKLRQTRNMWMDIQQVFTGQKAELRAAEQVQAEQNLLAVLKVKGTREASIQIANMEKDIRIAIEQGNLDQARKIKNQQAALTLVTVQADIDKALSIANVDKETRLAVEQGKINLETVLANLTKDQKLAIEQANIQSEITIANLDKERILAVEQGKLDLATKIANLEKNILISKVNTEVALESRKMDDSLAIAAFGGEQSLQGLETEINLAELKSDLTTAGFELQKKLALMTRETKLAVARLVADLKAEENSADRKQSTINSLIGAIATIGAGYLRYKTGGIL
jgi:hypothetical protein